MGSKQDAKKTKPDQLTTTIIQPSPGTTTEVIIRPAVVDDPNSAGKTRVFRVPTSNDPDWLKITVASPPPAVTNPVPTQGPISALVTSPSPITAPVASPPITAPVASPPITAASPQPITALVSSPQPITASVASPQPITASVASPQPITASQVAPDQGDTGQGRIDPAMSNPAQVKAVPASGSKVNALSASPYSYQSQQNPLPGLRSVPATGALPELLSSDPAAIQQSNPNQFTMTLEEVVLDIQMLSGTGVINNDDSSGSNAFAILEKVEHIFIEPAPNEFSEATFVSSQPFNLLDSSGNRLFCGLEKKQKKPKRGCCKCECKPTPPIQLAIFAPDGTECMSIAGSTMYVAVRESSTGVLGITSEVAAWLPPLSNYVVRNNQGQVLFKIMRDRATTSPEFDLYGNDMIRIGHIGKFWGNLPESAVDLSHSFGINFPKDLTPNEKALLLGAVVLIYWKYYGDIWRDRRDALNAWCCVCWCFLILLLIIFALAVLAAYILHPT